MLIASGSGLSQLVGAWYGLNFTVSWVSRSRKHAQLLCDPSSRLLPSGRKLPGFCSGILPLLQIQKSGGALRRHVEKDDITLTHMQ